MAKKSTMQELELKLKLLRREEQKRMLFVAGNPSDYNKKELTKLRTLINEIGEEMVKIEMEQEYGK